MRCGKARKYISVRLDGELTKPRLEAVEKHLLGCDACNAFAAELGRAAKKLDSLSAPEPRWGFTERLIARAENDDSARSVVGGWFELLRPAELGFGAVAFFAGVVLTILSNGRLPATGADTVQTAEATANEYVDLGSETTVDQTLLALLPDVEE